MQREPVLEASLAPAAAPTVYRGRLFRKYFLLILALVCGALLISGAISVYFSYQENKTALASLEHEKAVAAAARIEQFVREIEKQLAFVALPQLGGVEQRRFEFLKLLRLVPAVTDISQIGADGREQLSVSRVAMDVNGSGKDRSHDPAFEGAKLGKTWFGPVYFRKQTEPYMSIAVRSKSAVTVAEVNLKFIWDVITRIKVGQKGKAYVVDGAGHLVADPDIGLVLRKTGLSALPQVKAALRGDTGVLAMQAQDLAGKSVLTAWAPIEPLGWKVFVEQPVSEVYAALDATILRTAVLLVAGLMFSALTALWLARSMVRPIRTLQEGAQKIGAGELDQRIEVKSGDELEALAGQFNDMTARLRESYAGLERKVEERTRQLSEALEQQTASSEILRTISGSPTDVTPVFETILDNAVKLCDSPIAAVFRFDGTLLHLVATKNWPAEALDSVRERWPAPPSPHHTSGRVILTRDVVRQEDTLGDASYDRPMADAGGWRRMLGVPMLREGAPIGAIVVAWPEPGPIPERQVALLKTFADQAVIAIENVRLFNETREALERQTATADILRVISGSPTETQPVFNAILESASRLCDAETGILFRYESGAYRAIATRIPDPAFAEVFKQLTLPTPKSGLGRVLATKAPVHIPDVLDDDAYREGDPLRRNTVELGKVRSWLGVPMLKEGALAGAIVMYRKEQHPFSEHQIALLQTFADQAVIAIENVRLFNETREALERQTAIADVLKVITGSPTSTGPVFDAIASSALRLFDGTTVQVLVAAGDRIESAAAKAMNPQAAARLQARFPIALDRHSLAGRIMLDRATQIIPDTEAPGVPELARSVSQVAGMRSLLGAPMMREGVAIGAIVLGREHTGEFAPKQVALLQTFADQAAIAIENVRLFHEIEDKSRQLEVANKHKSDFLANMSHELRTPLNAIIGFSEVLIERMFGEVNEKQADYLKDIHESGRHLLSLINDILDLSKIEAGRMELDLAEVDVPAALSNALTLVRERAQRHGIALSLAVDPALGTAAVDERKFKQVVLNLLSNAVKFTPDGGKVAVSAKLDTDHIEVAVADTGIGIAPEDQEAVFEEFKQVGSDYTKKAEGTGLGLALTRRIVELHGGRIWLESQPGKGSTFTFTLPLRRPEARA